MKKWSKVIFAAMICALTASVPIQSFADGPEPNPEAQDAERWARLKDNVLEFDEIEDLIKEYNPAVQVSENDHNTNLAKKKQLEKELRQELKDTEEEMGLAPGSKDVYDMYRTQISSMKKSIDSMQSATSTTSMKKDRDDLSVTAQNLMISYNQEKIQKEVLQKSLEVAQAAEASTQAKAGLGLATELDVLNAQKSVRSIEAQITELDSSTSHLKQSLCLMTGWAYNADPEIREIPAINLADLDAINLQEDIEKAIGNNYTLREYRLPGASGGTLSKKEIHSRNVEDGEQKVKINMESLYNDLQAKRIDYETSLTNFQKAENDMQAADRKYQLGLLSREEYLQQQASYITVKAGKEKADMTLFQTWQAYKWAVRGVMTLDPQAG